MSLLKNCIESLQSAEFLCSIRFDMAPVAASRPRMTKRGAVFYEKKYAGWLKDASLLTKGALALDRKVPLVVLVESVIERARTSKLLFPTGDADNLAKGPLDAITKATGYWEDDTQIVNLISTKRFACPEEQPHTTVEIYLAKA